MVTEDNLLQVLTERLQIREAELVFAKQIKDAIRSSNQAAPGVHPSKAAAPGTWCFGCDNPKRVCKCRKGEDDEEELDEDALEEEAQHLLEELLSQGDNVELFKELDASVKLKKSSKELAELLDRKPSMLSEQESNKISDFIAYLIQTKRHLIGLDGKFLDELEIKGLMKKMFSLVPDALDLKNEEVYEILQSHDFQRLAYELSTFEFLYKDDPELKDIIAAGIKFEYTECDIVLKNNNGDEIQGSALEKLKSKPEFCLLIDNAVRFHNETRPKIKKISKLIREEDIGGVIDRLQIILMQSLLLPSAASSMSVVPNLRSKGGIEVSVGSKKPNGKQQVTIIYRSEKDLDTPPHFSYRDDIGFGHLDKMVKQADGSWVGTREMYPNESSELSIHLNMNFMEEEVAPDFSSGDHFQTHISLLDGELVKETHRDEELELRGQLKQMVHNEDGTLKEFTDSYSLQEGEEIVNVYLPPGYEQMEDDLPVHVMLDGDMHVGTDAFGNQLRTPDILDNLISSGQMSPVIAVFSAPSSPTPVINADGEEVDKHLPRLREYGCSATTAKRLAELPVALGKAGLKAKPDGAYISGASMGGIQAIYTAKTHPDVFGHVLAQSPAAWWEPPAQLEGDAAHVRYNQDGTWRETPRFKPDFESDREKQEEMEYRGFIHNLLSTGKDFRTGATLPVGHEKVEIQLQVGRRETGIIHQVVGVEPLTQATRTLAKEHGINLQEMDGPHSPGIWATGLVAALPQIHPKARKSWHPMYGAIERNLTPKSVGELRKVLNSWGSNHIARKCNLKTPQNTWG